MESLNLAFSLDFPEHRIYYTYRKVPLFNHYHPPVSTQRPRNKANLQVYPSPSTSQLPKMRFYTNVALAAVLFSLANTAPTPIPNDALAFPVRSYTDDKRDAALNAVKPDSEKRGAALNAVKPDSEKRGAAVNAVKPDSEKRDAALNAVKPDSEKRGAALNAVKPDSEKREAALNAVKPDSEKRGAALNAVKPDSEKRHD
jgi:hypothetical protein